VNRFGPVRGSTLVQVRPTPFTKKKCSLAIIHTESDNFFGKSDSMGYDRQARFRTFYASRIFQWRSRKSSKGNSYPPIIPQNEKSGAARFPFLREIVRRSVLTSQRGIPSSHPQQNGGPVMVPQMAVICFFHRAIKCMSSLQTTINLINTLQLKCGALSMLLSVLFLYCLHGRRDKARSFSTFLTDRLRRKRGTDNDIFASTIDFNY